MEHVDLAIIGGTGVYKAEMLENSKEFEVNTEYGKASLLLGQFRGRKVAFLARHGKGHTVPPHLVNYRANIMALKTLGAKRVISTTAVGSLNEKMKPADFVLVDQFLDFTKTRANSFYEGGEKGVLHVDVSEPYCREIREFIFKKANDLSLGIHFGGCYVCTEGPRFETPAEIKMYKLLGGDLVGMTNVPEVVLAREAGLCYATVSLVTNYAAGISPSVLTHAEVLDVMQKNSGNFSRLIMATLESIPLEGNCLCRTAPAEAGSL